MATVTNDFYPHEPWKSTNYTVFDNLGQRIVGAPNKLTHEQARHITDRIAACVNFCAGLTNEQLAAMGTATLALSKTRREGYNEGREYQLQLVEDYYDDDGK